MATNEFVPFATGTGANTYSVSSYLASNARLLGVVDGEADPKLANNAWRQPSVIGAMIGAFIASQDFDALDDGNLSNLLTNFTAALNKVGAAQVPGRQRVHYGEDTGIANRIVANVSPDIAGYEAGAIYWVLAKNAPTGPAVANLDDRGDRNIVRRDGSAVQSGDWAAGEIIELRDNGTRLQLAGLTSNAAFQTFITQFYATPLTYWRMDSPNATIPANTLTAITNYTNRIATVNTGTDVSQSSGVVTIGPNDAGVYILTATNAMDIPTTEESIFIFLQRAGTSFESAFPISTGRGPYPSPGNNANDQSTPAIYRLAVGDKVFVTYQQKNDGNAAANTLNQPLGHFGGVRVGG